MQEDDPTAAVDDPEDVVKAARRRSTRACEAYEVHSVVRVDLIVDLICEAYEVVPSLPS